VSDVSENESVRCATVAQSHSSEPDELPGPESVIELKESPFAHVQSRRSVDELLTDIQQALVLYTGQADMKANIVITTSSLVLTIVATRWSEHSLRPGLSAVSIFTLLALITAITVVIPKFRLPRKGEARADFEPHENPLFFGHFASVMPERFVEVIAAIAKDDAVLYEAQTVDIHEQGRYLVEKKYKHLRAAYIFLGLAFVAGAVAQAVAAAF
jgi:Pycsar effector protein